MAPSHDLYVIAPTQPRKRVMVACDYCRKKRLKCTSNQDPCMNCQLYGAECIKSSGRAWRGRHLSSNDNSEASQAEQIGQAPTQAQSETGPSLGASHSHPQEPSWTGSTLSNNTTAFFSQSEPWELSLSYHERTFADVLFDTGPLMAISPIPTQVPHAEGGVGSARWTLSDPPHTQNHSGEDEGSRKEDAARKYHVWLPKLELPQPPTESQIMPGLFVDSATSRSGYIGRHSIGGTLSSCIRDAHGRNSNLQTPAFDFISKAAYYVDKARDHGLIGGFEYDLPLRSFAARSIEAYFRHVHVVYPLLDKESFLAGWEQLYDQPSSNRNAWMVILLCLVVAIGAVCDKTDTEIARQAEQISKSLHEQVWMVTHRALHTSSIEAVQAILLHVIFLLHRGKSSVAWTLCGMAIRISHVHGLHRKFPKDLERLEKELQLRSQIWWTAFSLDASCSMAEGRPPAAWEDDCDAGILPLSQTTNNDEEDSSDVLSALYIARIKMAQMENRFCRVLSRRETMVDKLRAIAQIDQSLIEWRDALPIDYRPEQEILVQQDRYQIVALLHLKYFSLMRAIHWVSIDCSLGHNSMAGQQSHPRLRASEAICLAAARGFIGVLNNVDDHSGQKCLFPITLHTDQYMATLAILYRNMLKNPGRASAKSDLELFRVAKEYLERDLFHENYEPKLGATMKAVFEEMMRVAERAIESTRATKSLFAIAVAEGG